MAECPNNVCNLNDSFEANAVVINYFKDLMENMNMLRNHRKLTDVILEVGSELFHAHRLVLAAASPYFQAMFTVGLKECHMHRVRIEEISPCIMQELLSYMYNGLIQVTEYNILDMLPAATMLQISTVIKMCEDFLETQLEPSNALGIAQFAEQYNCLEFTRTANNFISRMFFQISQEEEFFQLSFDELMKLIKRDELNVQEERQVYNSVVNWVNYDEENRYMKMADILEEIRCQFLTPKFLNDQIQYSSVIKKVPACQEILVKIFQDLTLHVPTTAKERTPNNVPKIMYIIGGYRDRSLDIFEKYNADEKSWTKMTRMIVPRSGLGCAVIRGHLYAVGGRNNSPGNSYDCDWIDRYDPNLREWVPCHPMSCPRYRVGVAVLDGLLYAVGGGECSKFLQTVERYDPEVDKWFIVRPMLQKRLGVGVAVVNRFLYAIGGTGNQGWLNSAECYHPENDLWHAIPPMSIKRSGAGVCSVGKYIYVIGGFNGRSLNVVERYDTENKEWEFRSSMKMAKSAFSVVLLDGKIHAMGGYNGDSFLKDVEVYDPDTDTWSKGTPLTTERSGHASVVCYDNGFHEIVAKTEPNGLVNPFTPDLPTTSASTSGC